MEKIREYTADEIRRVIDGRLKPERAPCTVQLWSHPAVFGSRAEEAAELMRRYPCDAKMVPLAMPDVISPPDDDPDYVWLKNVQAQGGTWDNACYLKDFDNIDGIIANFPNPGYKGLFKNETYGHIDSRSPNAYRLGHFWYLFFERHWSFRGMQNALTDFYDYPQSVHKLYGALADYYCAVILRAKRARGIDGIFVSDDIGSQTGPMFGVGIFLEFFKPYYKRVIDFCHSIGVQLWLHTCGNVTAFLPHFAEIGLDVLHPIQKNTMNEREVADNYGDKMCIWAGFDVQNILPFGTADDVIKETRRLKQVYKNSRRIFTLGNGVTPDCSLENLKALLDTLME